MPRRMVSLENPCPGPAPMLSVPLSSIHVLDVMGDIVLLEVKLGVVGARLDSMESELYVTSAGELVSVSPESLELNFDSLKVRIRSAMH